MMLYFEYAPPFPQFLTFAERLGNVNIDIIHRIDRTASYDEVRQCYTNQSSSIHSQFFRSLLLEVDCFSHHSFMNMKCIKPVLSNTITTREFKLKMQAFRSHM